MSHIHIPDGVLPVAWWLVGLLIVGILMIGTVRKIEKSDVRKKVPFIGVVGALMLITMSVPLGPLPFHINLTVLAGILAGPWLGFLAVFIVNVFLAFLGHGGITVVGINTLILGSEVFAGWALFRFIGRYAKVGVAAGVATVCALLISTTLMLSVVGISQAGWEYALPHDHNHHAEHIADHPGDQVHHADEELEAAATGSGGDIDGGHETLLTLLGEVSFLNMTGLVAIAIILFAGVALETLVTVLMVRFFNKVRPDLLK